MAARLSDRGTVRAIIDWFVALALFKFAAVSALIVKTMSKRGGQSAVDEQAMSVIRGALDSSRSMAG